MRLLYPTQRKKYGNLTNYTSWKNTAKLPKYRGEDSFKCWYLKLENTRMATEVQFLKDQLLEKITLS